MQFRFNLPSHMMENSSRVSTLCTPYSVVFRSLHEFLSFELFMPIKGRKRAPNEQADESFFNTFCAIW
jgi:hypothetical protein